MKELGPFAGLPVGSAVEARSDVRSVWVLSGPIQRSGDAWFLPVFGEEVFPNSERALQAGRQYRRTHGYGRRTVG